MTDVAVIGLGGMGSAAAGHFARRAPEPDEHFVIRHHPEYERIVLTAA